MKDFLPFIVVGITAGSVYGLAGTGLVLTYRTSGIFNFAYGTIAALMAYAFYDLRETYGLPWPVAMAICVFVLAPLVGVVLEWMARRVSDAPVALRVVATVGLLVAIQQLIVIRYGVATIRTPPFLPTTTFSVFGVQVGIDQVIIMVIALVGTLSLSWFLATRLGRSMRAVVEQPELLAMTGTDPAAVRRRAWFIGTAFAGLSGILLAPSIGLDVIFLTLLVVQAFGAAAIGMFTSIPLTYVGGLTLGVLSALATRYVGSVSWLRGVPASLPFIILFVVLLVAPARWLVDFTIERKRQMVESRQLPRRLKIVLGAGVLLLMLRLPDIAGTRLSVYSSALAYVVIFVSLALLIRTSGQVSLAQLGFAAVGSSISARLAAQAGLPWVVAVLAGALVAVPVGAVLAIPAIRRSGLYLALATFGFAVLLERMLYGTQLMFGGNVNSIPAPRPSFAEGDRAYFYVILVFVVAALLLVMAVHRSRLGRLARAMSDSPTALTTYGASVTRVKVIIFCVSAFLAGLGGALLGPVTGSASPGDFNSLVSLTLLVVLVVVPGSEIVASIGAAVLLVVLPSYNSGSQFNEYLPVLFGVWAILVAMGHAGTTTPGWLSRIAEAAHAPGRRGPLHARLQARTESTPA